MTKLTIVAVALLALRVHRGLRRTSASGGLRSFVLTVTHGLLVARDARDNRFE